MAPARQHRMLAEAGINVSRGSPILWANRAIELPGRSTTPGGGRCRERRHPDGRNAGRHLGRPGSMRNGHLWPVPGDRGEVPRRVFRNPDDRRPPRLRSPPRGPRRRGHPPELLGPCQTELPCSKHGSGGRSGTRMGWCGVDGASAAPRLDCRYPEAGNPASGPFPPLGLRTPATKVTGVAIRTGSEAENN